MRSMGIPINQWMTRRPGVCVLAVMLLLAGCQAPPGAGATRGGASAEAKRVRRQGPPIRCVRCLYEQWPWLNLDREGDRDPEGIRYRIYLDPETGEGKGVHRDGMLHIEIYRIDQIAERKIKRTLVSDYHYPTSAVHKVGKGMLGDGYLVKLVWADKDLAGREIELITSYEDPFGKKARSGTKRFKVPKYDY